MKNESSLTDSLFLPSCADKVELKYVGELLHGH